MLIVRKQQKKISQAVPHTMSTNIPQSSSSSSLEQTFTSSDQMSPPSSRQSRGRKVQSAIWHKGRDSLIFF
jgi:hypothetical protein